MTLPLARRPLPAAARLAAAALFPLCVAHATASAQAVEAASAAETSNAPAAAEAPGREISRAERELFLAPHLQGLGPGAPLRYRFVHAGTLGPGWSGPLELQLRAAADGSCCDAGAAFPEAEGPRPMPPVEGAKSNPVVLYFLEHDLREMQRLTQGQMNHFRRRIRLALAEDAQLADTRVRWQGQELPALRVRVSPYLDDPQRGRFQRYATKQYEFVLAAGVPGGVARLHTVVPGAEPGAEPLLEETLTLEGADFPTSSR